MSAIYMTNPNTTIIQQGNQFPIYINKRIGRQTMCFSGNSVVITSPGYYKIDAVVTLSAAEAGDVTVVARKNGTAIPGITATETITTPTTEIRTLVVSGIIRVLCHEGPVAIDIFNASELELTSSNVSLSVVSLS